MTAPSNHLELYKILPKTNCRQCDVPTCLAFAVGVMQGNKRLDQCPHLPPEVVEQYAPTPKEGPSYDDERDEAMRQLCQEAAQADLAAAAERVRGRWDGNKLTIRCLGSDFALGSDAVITSRCHNIPWLTVPLLNYVLHCKGRQPAGQWAPLRDLPGGEDWKRLFGQRCEKPFKQVVDSHTGLFETFVDIFSAKRAPDAFDSDIAVVMKPLPLLPMLVCYWKPEDGLDSNLNLFWDVTATDNLPIDAIYTLGVGLVTMFEKIARTHGG